MESNCEVSPKPKSAGEFFKSWAFWKPLLGILLGGIGGFLIYYYVGCKTGSCAITRNPISSIVTGSVLGVLLSSAPCLKCD